MGFKTWLHAGAALSVAGLIAGACGGAGGSASSESGSKGNPNGSGSNSGGIGGTFLSGSGGSMAGSGGLDECAGETHEADLTPVDLVLLLDQSGSMSASVGGQTVWNMVTGALDQFVSSPDSSGLGVGLQYFPLPSSACQACGGGNQCPAGQLPVTDQNNTCCCMTNTGTGCAQMDGTPCTTQGICFTGTCWTGFFDATCNANDYAALDVPIDLLPGNAMAITTSIANHGPTGLTPTAPALQGAISAAQQRAAAFPDHTVAVVLASDGSPTECNPQIISDIANIAANAATGTPPVLTFVIGIGNVVGLHQIAQAGNTGQAIIVSANSNAGQQFIDAMNQIQGSLLQCTFDVPQPDEGEVDYNRVNVEFTPGGGMPQTFGQVPSASECGPDGGWYYDNPAAPSQIHLCDASCDLVTAVTDGSVRIVLGCATLVL